MTGDFLRTAPAAPPRTVAFRRLPALASLTALAALALSPLGASGGELLDLLRPGSRPANGLAGDPFLSPFSEGMSWSRAVLDAPSGARTEAMTRRPLDGRGLPAELRGTRLDWIVSGTAPLPGPPVGLAVRFARPAFDAGWSSGGNGMRLGETGGALDVALRAPPVVRGLAVEGAFPVAGDRSGLIDSPATVEMSWFGGPWLALHGGVAWMRAADRVNARFSGEELETSLNLGSRRYQGDARIEPRQGLAVEASVSDAALAPLRGRAGGPEYTLEPAGTTRFVRGAIEWGERGGARALLRRTEVRTRIEADASWGGERFGQIGYANVDAQSWLAAFECPVARRGRILFDLESARGAAAVRAEVESWPFTTALEDLLGARRIARGAGSLEWEVAHAAIERPAGHRARLQAGVAWYDLRPLGAIESWRPVFLVFGRTDVQRRVLEVRRVQLGEVALGANLLAGGIELGAAARQIVFARALENASPAPASGEPAASGDTPRTRRRGLVGGRYEVTLARRF